MRFVGLTSGCVATAGRARQAKSRDDITSLMRVIYYGEDADSVPLQKDSELYVKELQDMPRHATQDHPLMVFCINTISL